MAFFLLEADPGFKGRGKAQALRVLPGFIVPSVFI
jgi:hypothetical protein